MIIYYCPQSNNNYSHNKLLFLTIPKFIKKKIYLLAPENFTSKINLHQFFKLKKNINSNSLNSNISIKILRAIGFIYLSINNTFILYKIIKKVNKKKITLIIDGYNSYDILFISFILKGIIKIRVLYRDLSFNFLHNFIQNFSFFLISKLNKNLKIIELDSFDKKKSHLSNGKIINHPLISSPQASSIKNVGNNILLAGSYRPEKGFNNIKKILNYKKMDTFCFLLNLKSKNKIIERKNFSFFNDSLPYKEYLRLVKKSNFILFPYTHKKYKNGISGIFTDCIAMNKIPIVHKDTFVGKLLKKNKLKICLYDFYDYKNFYSKIKLIDSRRTLVQKNVIKFKKKYLSYFSKPVLFWNKCLK